MANAKLCGPCTRGRHRSCRERWEARSARKVTGGTAPKPGRVYSYRCACRHNGR